MFANGSNVFVSKSSETVFGKIKNSKIHQYAIFYVRDSIEIEVETIGKRNPNYNQFLKDIRKFGATECRFGLFNYGYEVLRTSECFVKLFLMLWIPETAQDEKKFLYPSMFSVLKESLAGVDAFIKARDLDEASMEVVEKQFFTTDHQ